MSSSYRHSQASVMGEPVYRSSHSFIQTKRDAVIVDYLALLLFGLSFAGSVVALGVGAWTLAEENYFSIILGQDTMTASAWLLMLAGVIGVLVALFSCVALSHLNQTLMYVYCCVQALVLIMLTASWILATVYKAHINTTPERIEEDMRLTIRDEYGVNLDNDWNRRITDAYDDTQAKMYCCSVEDESWEVYQDSEWHQEQPPMEEIFVAPYVPESCCVTNLEGEYLDVVKCQTYQYGPPAYPNLGGLNEGLYYMGCFLPAKDRGNYMTDILIGISICVGLLTILPALLFALYMATAGIPSLIQMNEKRQRDRQSMVSAGGAFTDMYGYT